MAASAKKARAFELISDAMESGKGAISYQVVQEFFDVAFRRFSPKMTPAEAEPYLALTLEPVLVGQSSYVLFTAALALDRRHSLPWYDRLIAASAMESDGGTLYTESPGHRQSFGHLIIKNPSLSPERARLV